MASQPVIRPGPKGAPPESQWRRGRAPYSLQIESLDLNESVLVTVCSAADKSRVRGVAYALGRKLGRRYVTRMTDDHTLGVWRLRPRD